MEQQKSSSSSKTLMSWTRDRDVIFCREILVSNLFQTKKSSMERGKVWEAIADSLCDIREPSFRVDQRAVRDHYKKLVTRAKKKAREEKSASGISPVNTELDTLLEEIIEREEMAELMKSDDDENKKKVEADKVAADDMRRKAMEKLAETKKRKGDDEGSSRKKRMNVNETVAYLREKTQMEMNMRKEELELKDKQLVHQAAQQDQQNNLIKLMVEQHQQQQQQTQAMHMMMSQQQQQQTQALLTLIEKLSN